MQELGSRAITNSIRLSSDKYGTIVIDNREMIEVAGGNSITTVVLKVDMNRRFDMYIIIS